jgi:hypothetical protein
MVTTRSYKYHNGIAVLSITVFFAPSSYFASHRAGYINLPPHTRRKFTDFVFFRLPVPQLYLQIFTLSAMRFSTFAAAILASVTAATAQTTWDVVVGGNGTLTFSPNVVNASIGDTVAFTLCVSLNRFQKRQYQLF